MNRYDELALRLIEHPDSPVLFREWLRMNREQCGLRQLDVAALLKEIGSGAALTRTQVSRLESGRLAFDFLTVAQTEGLRTVLQIPKLLWSEKLIGTVAGTVVEEDV